MWATNWKWSLKCENSHGWWCGMSRCFHNVLLSLPCSYEGNSRKFCWDVHPLFPIEFAAIVVLHPTHIPSCFNFLSYYTSFKLIQVSQLQEEGDIYCSFTICNLWRFLKVNINLYLTMSVTRLLPLILHLRYLLKLWIKIKYLSSFTYIYFWLKFKLMQRKYSVIRSKFL